jgi:cytochrome b6-f complex iron-sulfur subunit
VNAAKKREAKGEPISRRDFLSLAWKSILALSGLLGLGGLARFFAFQPQQDPPSQFDLGPEAAFSKSSPVEVAEAEALIWYTPDGYRALSLVCPHLGCKVERRTDGFTCPCHGSSFTSEGALKHGPADRPLRSLNLSVDQNQHLILEVSST